MVSVVCDQQHPNINLEAGTRGCKFQMLMEEERQRVVCPQLQEPDSALPAPLSDTLPRELRGRTPHFILTQISPPLREPIYDQEGISLSPEPRAAGK